MIGYYTERKTLHIVFELMFMDLNEYMISLPDVQLISITLIQFYCRQVTKQLFHFLFMI